MSKRFIQTLGGSLAAGLLLAGGVVAQNRVSASDMKFAREAAIGGMEEVELGKIAQKNASNDQVKQFGKRMADDHTKAADDLKAWASKENVQLPTELDAKHKAEVSRFESMKGQAFDRAYMNDMVKDHETDVAAFRKESEAGNDSGLKSFAGKTLPTLEDHLKLAHDTARAVGAVSMK